MARTAPNEGPGAAPRREGWRRGESGWMGGGGWGEETAGALSGASFWGGGGTPPPPGPAEVGEGKREAPPHFVMGRERMERACPSLCREGCVRVGRGRFS